MESVRQFRLSLVLLMLVMGGGTVGYALIEGWTAFDSLYMTVITVATVGFKEVRELSPEGKLFTILLIISGTGIIAYAIGSMIRFMVEGQLLNLLGRKKVQNRVSKLRQHYIVCGYGRIGSLICRELVERPLPFVVVERSRSLCERLFQEGILFVEGNATDDDVLLAAGIEHAAGLITAVTSDTDNVYITLTARGLNPDLFILARAGEEGSEKKLLRAGASKVVSPYTIGAFRMAQAVLRPSVVDFIEIATGRDSLELQLEEIPIAPSSELVGRSLLASGIRQAWGIIIVGIKRPDGTMVFNPPPATTLESEATLITLGERPAIVRLEDVAAGRQPLAEVVAAPPAAT